MTGLKTLEMIERVFAAFEGNYNRENFEACLKLHRYHVMVWLMQNNVSIPLELLNDELHKTH